MRLSGAMSSVVALAAVAGLAGVLCATTAANAEDCPGNPDAIGTSRVIQIDPADYPRIGSFQYPLSLPLEDHEVVLSFDDGPLPPHSTRVLDVLAAQCVKANFFLVGEMARNFPAVVRRISQDGHVIGTHSEDHPLRFGQLPVEKIRWEIDKGIADVAAALGDPQKVAPFFRIPGFARSDVLEDELAQRKLAVFSTDTVEDDWHRHINAKKIIELALSRLEQRGRGILLLHDIHPWTADALPGLLKELKDHGFHLVQVQPAPAAIEAAIDAASELTVAWTPGRQETVDGAAAPIWPMLASTARSDAIALPIADAAMFDADTALAPAADTGKIETASADDTGLPAHEAAWPQPQHDELASDEPTLPTPDVADLGWPVRMEPIFNSRLGLRPGFATAQTDEHTAAIGHGRHRQGRVAANRDAAPRTPNAAHSVGHRHAHAPATAGEHAGLASRLAALLTPAK
jgi:peptidoglycan-N-acetylglucosamine deacetylase